MNICTYSNQLERDENGKVNLKDTLNKIKNVLLKYTTPPEEEIFSWQLKPSWNIGDNWAGFLKSIKVMDEKEAALIANINALEASLESLDNDRRACKAELDQKIRERNAKEKELKKYCWVPFYNIYLFRNCVS